MKNINETRPGWMDPDHQNPNHEENMKKRYRKECMEFYNRWTDRFVILNSDEKLLQVYKSGTNLDTPECYTWISGLKGTIPFKSIQSARSFIEKYADIPLYSPDITRDDFVPSIKLGDEKIKIRKVEEVIPYLT